MKGRSVGLAHESLVARPMHGLFFSCLYVGRLSRCLSPIILAMIAIFPLDSLRVFLGVEIAGRDGSVAAMLSPTRL